MKNTGALITAICIALCSACSTSIKEIRGPNGDAAYAIACRNKVGNCYEKAGDYCKNGYKIINNTSSVSSGGGYSDTDFSMIVSCK